MTNHEEPTPLHVERWGNPASFTEWFNAMQNRLDQIDDKFTAKFDAFADLLATGKQTFATMELRLRALEIIVYGACGMALVSVLGAALYFFVRQGGSP